MESKPLDDSSATNQVATYLVPHIDREDEISFIDLWRMIARRKGIILSSLLASIILATAHLFVTVPEYRTEAHLLPPQEQDIQELLIAVSQGQIKTELYTTDRVYKEFVKNLKSFGLRRQFFDSNNLVTHYASENALRETEVNAIFDTKFSKNLIIRVDQQEPSFISVGFVFTDPKLAAQWLNEFIVFANEQTVHQLYTNINATIESEIKKVRAILNSKLQSAKKSRLDRIIGLEEALQIANALRIENANLLPLTSSKSKAGIEINTAEVPLYMRGVKALEAEISALKSRESDEPFIKGLRDLQERLAFLRGISINPEIMSTVTIDAAANTPYQKEGHGKALTVLSAAVLGIIVGILMTFIAEFLSNAREEQG